MRIREKFHIVLMASAGEFPIKEGNMLLSKVPLSLENATQDTEKAVEF